MFALTIFSCFVGSAIAGLGGRFLGARGASIITLLGISLSFLFSVCVWIEVSLNGNVVCLDLGTWFQGDSLCVHWFLLFDALTACMLVTVSGVSLCVHLYSVGYMQHDPHLPRFMSYLSLFSGSMLLLVSSGDLIVLLIGWELIGISSYLLIGFWFHRLRATKAAVQAVLVNRVSDTILMMGLILSWWYLGATDLAVITACSTHAYYTQWLCFAILGGALGKSAQIGLHIWLAEAMEGPTPVSALIHAATLVTAGIYVIARTSALWECSYSAKVLIVFVGALTSFFAACLGLVQNDLKRVIAYSTMSQLGYMLVACGLGAYSLAIYHLITHACFKALLFLGAGVAIHATSDVQDLRLQGGAHQALPWAWGTLLLGTLSLTGVPFLAGFYSKDAILEIAWATPGAYGTFSYLVLMAVAAMTSAYSFRVLYACFVSAPNARRVEISQPGVPLTMAVPLLILSAGSIVAGYCLSDALAGWGSSFWTSSLNISPGTNFLITSHIMPTWASWLPLVAVVLGPLLAYAYTNPLPWCVSPGWKAVYLFLIARGHFDLVFNQQVANPVLKLGFYSWALLDKGVLEVLGPTGLSALLYNWVLPKVNEWQTGTVHDYAIAFKITVLFGLAVVAFCYPVGITEEFSIFQRKIEAFPVLWYSDFWVDPRSLSVSLTLIATLLF
jgi:NADH-quinone oxidoreductase subunit L